MQCAFDLSLHTCLLDSIFLQSGTCLSLNTYYSFYIYLEKYIYVYMCMCINKHILTALARVTTHKPDLCRSQITLFNETLTSEWKYPKFAEIVSEWQTASVEEPNEKTCSGHSELGIPEGCLGPRSRDVGSSSLPSLAYIVFVGWLADHWLTRGINSKSRVFPLMYKQPPRPL